MRKLLLVLALFLAPGLARADFVTFQVAPSSDVSSFIGYDGLGGALTGSGISVPSVLGVGTPANDGTAQVFLGTTLSFTTGNYIDNDGGHGWHFGPGGGLQITKANGTVLLSGIFTGITEIVQTANDFKIIGSSHVSTIDAGLASFYGVPNSPYDGGMTILFSTVEKPGQGFSTAAIHGGAVSLDVSHPAGSPAVPEPSSIVLTGMGACGLLLKLRRRKV